MPPDRPLNEADIRLIEQWILDGAKKDNRQTTTSDGGPNEAGASDARADAAGRGDASSDVAPDGGRAETAIDLGNGDVGDGSTDGDATAAPGAPEAGAGG